MSSPGGAASPIVLGQIEPLGYHFDTELGAAQAAAEINGAGGLLGGRPLHLELRDDRADPQTALAEVRALLAVGVSSFVGSSFSNSSLAVIPEVERARVPYVAPAAADELVDPVRPFVFITPPTARTAAEQLLRYCRDHGLRRLVLGYDGHSLFSRTGVRRQRALADSYGVAVVAEHPVSVETTDFGPLLATVAQSRAQALLAWLGGPAAPALTRQYASSGVGVPLLMSHVAATPRYLRDAGPAAEGVIVATTLAAVAPTLPDSAFRDSALAMRGRYLAAHGMAPAQNALDGYSAVRLIAAAIESAGSAAPERIRRALERLTLSTPEGVYRYSPTNHRGLDPEDMAIAVVRGGDFAVTDWSRRSLAERLR